jgi:hypothetical protein
MRPSGHGPVQVEDYLDRLLGVTTPAFPQLRPPPSVPPPVPLADHASVEPPVDVDDSPAVRRAEPKPTLQQLRPPVVALAAQPHATHDRRERASGPEATPAPVEGVAETRSVPTSPPQMDVPPSLDEPLAVPAVTHRSHADAEGQPPVAQHPSHQEATSRRHDAVAEEPAPKPASLRPTPSPATSPAPSARGVVGDAAREPATTVGAGQPVIVNIERVEVRARSPVPSPAPPPQQRQRTTSSLDDYLRSRGERR